VSTETVDTRRRLILREHETQVIAMSPSAARDLMRLASGRVVVTPAPEGGQWHVTATHHVGTVVLPELELLIRPKIPIDNLFLLLDVGLPEEAWRPESFAYASDPNLLPILATFFARTLERTVATGLLRAYRTEAARLIAVRGRIDFPAQVRQPGVASPVACRFDEYTADIDENRYLKAAVRRLLRVPGVRPETRRGLSRELVRFEEVADVHVDVDLPGRLILTRLSRHYRPVLRLARLVLGNVGLLDRPGQTAASSFLLDMNDLFQRFVGDRLARHLHGHLEVSEEPVHHLGINHRVAMQPDLVFRTAEGHLAYVGDAKYKATSSGLGRSSDYYQLLAYTTALRLREGVLIYCQVDGEAPPRLVEVRHTGARLCTYALHLAGTPAVVEESLAELAEWIAERAGVDDRLAQAYRPVPAGA
jgi:5-methylcytosine-specific restriction enzyme subunit McrC